MPQTFKQELKTIQEEFEKENHIESVLSELPEDASEAVTVLPFKPHAKRPKAQPPSTPLRCSVA